MRENSGDEKKRWWWEEIESEWMSCRSGRDNILEENICYVILQK